MIRSLLLAIFFIFSLINDNKGAELKKLDKKIHNFLLHQQNRFTGLVESFFNTTDSLLHNQASTYDQALSALGFLVLGDYKSSYKILSFFEKKFSGKGFCNFYNTLSGKCGIETTVHLGPNMWIALASLWYSKITGDKRFYRLGMRIAKWAHSLNHISGGVVMGPFPDWGGDWTKVCSCENNIVSYVVFRYLSKVCKDKKWKRIFVQEIDNIKDFIRDICIKIQDNKIININVGFSINKICTTTSSDVVSMLLLGFSPKEIRDFFNTTSEDLVKYADERFLVKTDNIQGYDFTDLSTCSKIPRPRMISLEWTLQMGLAFLRISDFYLKEFKHTNNRHFFDLHLYYLKKANFLISEVDKKIVCTHSFCTYPYSTKAYQQVFNFAFWWKTPQGDPSKSGSIASTMWRLFVYKKFNPLDLR